MTDEERVPLAVGKDDIDERYVAALILLAEISEIEVIDAHNMVDVFLDEMEIDVDRTHHFYTDTLKKKRSLH